MTYVRGGTTARESADKRVPKGIGSFAPDFCNALGVLLIVLVFALTLPFLMPQLLGYQVFDVVSASMEPEIPAGSVVYVRTADPADVQVDEIIAFMDKGSTALRRVTENRVPERELITKADANEAEDADSVSYEALLGVVALHVPVVGMAMPLYTSSVGKVYLFLTLGCGILLNLHADRMRKERTFDAMQTQLQGDDGAGQVVRGSRQGRWVRTVLMCVLAMIFLGTGGVVLYVRHRDQIDAEKYASAAQAFTSKAYTSVVGTSVAPIEVDFDALRAVNPDVIGWIYCEGTNINYPVMRGETNETYLRHNYLGEYSVRGSIFVDADCQPGFVDAETIVYGHHMSSGTMFAELENWSDQAFYDQHPYLWLLTPTQNYQVVLVSGHHADAHSDLYKVRHEHGDAFAQYLVNVVAQSDFAVMEGIVANPEQNYVMLSTCSYVFDDARYVLHGMLVPAVRADGER